MIRAVVAVDTCQLGPHVLKHCYERIDPRTRTLGPGLDPQVAQVPCTELFCERKCFVDKAFLELQQSQKPQGLVMPRRRESGLRVSVGGGMKTEDLTRTPQPFLGKLDVSTCPVHLPQI